MAGGEKNHLFQFPALHSGERELEGNLTLTNCIFPTRNFLDGWMAKKYISWAQTKLNRQTWFRTWLIIRSRRKKHPINARKIPHIFFASEHERKCLAETRQVLPPKTKTCSFPQTKCTSCILLSLLLRPTCIVRPQREVKGKKESLQILRDNRPPTKKKKKIEGKTALCATQLRQWRRKGRRYRGRRPGHNRPLWTRLWSYCFSLKRIFILCIY